MILIDTSAWFASFVAKDQDHGRVVSWLGSNSLPLVTTDYIVDETLTLLQSRNEEAKAMLFGRRMFDLRDGVRLIRISDEDLLNAWAVFRNNSSRGWSFTDCTSLALMDRLHIRRALSLDRHFREFGSIEVVPAP